MPGEEIAFTVRPKINSHSQIFRYGQRIFCLPHQPNFSDFFDLCLHWVSVVRGLMHMIPFGLPETLTALPQWKICVPYTVFLLSKNWFPYYKHYLILVTVWYIWNNESKSYSYVRYSPPKFFCECTFPLVIKRATLNRPISTRNEPNFFGLWRVL